MIRITVACVALLLAAPEPAPEIEYTLRFEETGITTNYPAGTAPTANLGVEADPNEKMITLTEIPVVPGRSFRVKMQVPQATRVLSGSSKLDPDVKDNVRVRVAFSSEFKDEDGLPATTRVETEVSLKVGQRLRVSGLKNRRTQTQTKNPVEKWFSYGMWVTLLE